MKTASRKEGLQKRRFRESLPLRMPKLHRRILKKLKCSLTIPRQQPNGAPKAYPAWTRAWVNARLTIVGKLRETEKDTALGRQIRL